jgi:hypothetical protein
MAGMSLISLLVLAQPSNAYLDEAQALARDLEFSRAVERIKVAQQVPGLDRVQRLTLWSLLARCEVAQGHRAEAEGAFTELLTLSPDFEPARELSPKILEAFAAAKARLYPRDYVKLLPQSGRPGVLTTTLVDPWRRVANVRAAVAADTEPLAPAEVLRVENRLEVQLPEALEQVRARLEVEDAQGAVLATREETVAVSAPVSEVRAKLPRWQRVLPWVLTGVALAAAGTATGLQLHSQALARAARDPSAPPGDFADTARGTNAQATTEARASIGLFVGAGVAGAVAVFAFAW